MKAQKVFEFGLNWLGTSIGLILLGSLLWAVGWTAITMLQTHPLGFALIAICAVMAFLITAIKHENGGANDETGHAD